MLFPAKINIIFGISTSNNAGVSKIYEEIQVVLHSLTFTNLLTECVIGPAQFHEEKEMGTRKNTNARYLRVSTPDPAEQ